MLTFSLLCRTCGETFTRPAGPGRPAVRCSPECKAHAKRLNRHKATQARLDKANAVAEIVPWHFSD